MQASGPLMFYIFFIADNEIKIIGSLLYKTMPYLMSYITNYFLCILVFLGFAIVESGMNVIDNMIKYIIESTDMEK